MRILAGDLGGTKTNLSLYELDGDRPPCEVRQATYPSRDHAHLAPILADFLAGELPGAAAFGVAGPVAGGRSHLPNLGWVLEEAALSEALGGAPVRLLNDLEATALGVLELGDDHLELLRGPAPDPTRAAAAVMAPGTGYGAALLIPGPQGPVVVPTESGHADLAPRSPEEERLAAFLRDQLRRPVSWEDCISGPGLARLYAFCCHDSGVAPDPRVASARLGGDPPAVIAQLALGNEDSLASRALGLFVRLLGREAGNTALRTLARGGLYLAGGIPAKVLPALRDRAFLDCLEDKARLRELLEAIPVAVVLDDRAAVRGATLAARRALPDE